MERGIVEERVPRMGSKQEARGGTRSMKRGIRWHSYGRYGTRLNYDVGERGAGIFDTNAPARIRSTTLHCLANLVLHHDWLSLFNDKAACA